MKTKLALIAMMFVFTACSTEPSSNSQLNSAAPAHKSFLIKYDLTKKFADEQFNMYSDAEGANRMPDGYSFAVPAKSASDVTATFSDIEDAKCSVSSIQAEHGHVVVNVLADIDIDAGNCLLTIKLSDGRTAEMQLTSVGT